MLSFRIALRFLKSGRGQTVLIICGIGVAISAQIFIGLLITSLQQTIIDRTIGSSPQITITSNTSEVYIKEWQPVVNDIQQSGLVTTLGVSASGNAFIEWNKKTAPVLFRGLDSESIDNIYGIRASIYQGQWTAASNEVLVGRELKDSLGYNLGDRLVVQTAGGATGNYKISGFFDLGVSSLNKTWIISNLSTAQALFGYGKNITSIEMKVEDLFKADLAAAQLKTILNNKNLSIDNWKAQNQELLSGLQGQTASSLMIQIFIIVSVVIAIASILAITVFQKSRQLGILKAMGIKDRAASLIFIYEGLIVGLIGSVIGVLLGIGLLYGFAVGTTKPGQPALINLYIDYQFVALSWGISILAAVLAALIPARRSLRLNPIDVIREG
jgi:lipoprotein-releasing system permease protein